MKRVYLISACLIGMGTCQVANAVSYDFSNVWSGSTPAGSPPWITLEVTQSQPGVVSLTLNAVNLPGTEFISLFEYNIGGGKTAQLYGTPSGGVDPLNGQGQNGFNFAISRTDGSLSFNANVDFPPPPGGNANEFVGGEYFTWQLSGDNLTVDDIDVPMLIHVQSIAPNGGSSKVYGTTAPVPDGGVTVAMLGIGLMGLAGLRRKLA